MRGSRTHSGYDAVYNWRRLAETQVRVLGPQGAIINICRSSRSENKWQRCVTSDVCCGSLAKQSVNSRGRRSVMKLRIHGCLRNEALIKLPVRWTARHWVDDAIDFISDTQYRWQRCVQLTQMNNLPHIFGSGCSRTSPWSPTVKSCWRLEERVSVAVLHPKKKECKWNRILTKMPVHFPPLTQQLKSPRLRNVCGY